MFKKSLIGLTVLAAIVFCCGYAAAEEDPVLGIDISMDFFGKYVWRGQVLTDDPVFQGAVTALYGGFSAGVWGNVDLTDYSDQSGEFTEVDYFADYSFDVPGLEGISFSVGVVNYHFPGVVGDTTEVYWSVGFDAPFSPSVTVYHDVDEIKGTYAAFGIGHDFGTILEIAEDVPVGMDFSASLGLGSQDYNEGYWGTDDGGLNDVSLSLAFPLEIAGWSVAPSLNYVTLVDGSIRSSDAFVSDSDYFYSGISFSKSF